jgi:hypothetical protein
MHDSSKVTNMIETEWVQVKRIQLLEYVHMVETLDKDHTRLMQQVSDANELAAVIDATWQARLDKLTDVVLDLHPSRHTFEAGLLRAYNIMAGHE